ncbi:hypothetical protein ACI77I_25920 [Pseudomonas sp. D47]|uniref:hypothetical protein n=1 Tax=Pseudomonas sp. D47 TaxID=3159447 RepID=UPI00387B6A62
MSQESRHDRKKRLSRDRSARCRALKKQRLQAIGATKLKIVIGSGTASDIECIRQTGGFEESAEALVQSIRYMAAMARRDACAFRHAIDPRSFQ